MKKFFSLVLALAMALSMASFASAEETTTIHIGVIGPMTGAAAVTHPDEPVVAAARLMRQRGIGALPVCEDDGTLAGMLTDRDIVVRCVSAGDDPQTATVRGIMSRDPVTIEADADVRTAMTAMRAAQVRRLPVTEGGKLAGVLSIDDIARSGKWDMECAQALCGITANVCRR